ncbi:MAG: Rrf2 family transcriptional regulator [Oscillospiraceae bacterium]|nr:Rrf2 family transcriptional regulator [Oscillospiraceae bacterium]
MKMQMSVDYAIRILQYMHENRGGLLKAMEIADATGVSYNFYIKIANQLKKSGLLQSAQGRHGGYVLGRPAQDISIYDVFKCMEGELQIKSCMREHAFCAGGPPSDCKLRTSLQKLQSKMIVEMSNKSIADLADSDYEIAAVQKENILYQSRVS